MKSILFIIDSLGYGGAERQLVELIKRLSEKSSYKLHVACLIKTEIGYTDFLIKRGIEVNYFERKRKYGFVQPISGIINYIQTHHIDLVHTFMNMGSLVGTIAAKTVGKPVVCSAIRDAKNSSLKEKYLKFFLAKVADVFVSNSKAGFENRFSTMQPHFRVVYNGINFSKFTCKPNKQKLKKSLGIDNFYPIIGMIASLSKNKDHVTLINAFKSILKHYPCAALLLIGDGDKRDYLENFCIKLQVNKNVFFLGYRDDVELIYPVLDVHALLTNTNFICEGTSNALLEAMACGIPVVATNCGGTPEIINDKVDGLLVRPQSTEDVIRAIIYLLKKPEFAKTISKAAYLKVHNMFSLDKYVFNYEKLYKEILGLSV